jgi:adenylate cyclase
MAEERAERRLAAILAADVVGYSRLIGADEEGTLNQLRSIRAELTRIMQRVDRCAAQNVAFG